MPKALDITNQRFGHLVAIEKVASRSGKTYWKCRCDCGREKEIMTTHLTTGVTTTCANKECEFHYNPISGHKTAEASKCILCGKEFISNNYARRYCYDCSPEGVGSKVALRYKKRALKHQLVKYKGGKCENCGYDTCEGALQFHHRNPQEKDFTIAHINFNGDIISLEKLYQEVDKCSLLCANCHFEQHYLDDIDLDF